MSFPSYRLPGPLGRYFPVEDFGEDPCYDLPDPPSAWPNIVRSELRNTARVRALHPDKINQATSSLCGPASLMYLTAKYQPDMYERYVNELYETGVAWLGKIKVAPGEDCRNYNPKGELEAADWVALAGLRDSENDFWDYDEASDKVGGITIPSTLAGWLRDTGKNAFAEETNIYFTKGEKNFREAVELCDAGYEVILLINGNFIQEMPFSRFPLWQPFKIPNHWVVLQKGWSRLTSGDVKFKVFSWGEIREVPIVGGTMSMSMWLQNYWGYIACRP